MLVDTIVAISTPIGEGAIGIIRMSGPEAFHIIDQIFVSPTHTPLKNRVLTYGHIIEDHQVIDEVMVVKMHAPSTYTCEDVVEINCHGGIIPLREILSRIQRKGARMAERGEFTQRAFLNGRIDLTQAESVMDLISAKTKKGFDIALNQLEGHLSKRVKQARMDMMALMAFIEVGIDYPEEDIEDISYEEISDRLSQVEVFLSGLLENAVNGRILREGLKTAIVGKPNVGKSSLMNALLKDARAIVTEIAGTTRDLIEEFMNIGGIPIKLVDTAGIRDTEDVVEKIGVERSKIAFNEADLIIFMLNAAEALSEEDLLIMDLVKDKHAIVIVNKTDLEQKIDYSKIEMLLHDKRIIRTSIERDTGISDVEKAISEMVLTQQVGVSENEIISNSRHIHLLEAALKNVKDAKKATQTRLPYDFIEVDIKDAILNLGKITGESVESDLLNSIFSNFCLGK